MIPWQDAPAVVEKIQAVDTMGARALMFAVLTATRISEATDAQWGEIDLDKKLWTIPASRMKMRKPHVVPLSRQAIDLLNELLKVMPSDLPRVIEANERVCVWAGQQLVVHGEVSSFAGAALEWTDPQPTRFGPHPLAPRRQDRE